MPCHARYFEANQSSVAQSCSLYGAQGHFQCSNSRVWLRQLGTFFAGSFSIDSDATEAADLVYGWGRRMMTRLVIMSRQTIILISTTAERASKWSRAMIATKRFIALSFGGLDMI